MASEFKVVVRLRRRSDGGLRAWSDDVPGLVLSHSDPAKVMADIAPALEVILAEMLGCEVTARPLAPLPRTKAPDLAQKAASVLRRLAGQRLEFTAQPCAA